MHTSHRITLNIITTILILTTLTPTIAKAHPNTLPTDPNFKGIYEFSGHNSSTDATNPALAGTYLGYYWSQLEPQKGQYNWDLIDQQMQPWIDNGKNVILRVATAGWTSWDPSSNSGNATPQWVYDLGVSSVTEVDNAILPQYWNPQFLHSYNDFIQAFASHYDGNPNVSAIEMGIGTGGETKVDTRTNNPNLLADWQAIGYSDPIWWDTIQQIITDYSTSFQHTPLVVMPDASFIGKTHGYGESLVLNYAVSHNLWLQDNGLAANRTFTTNQWSQVSLISEQRDPTTKSGDALLDDMTAALNLGATYIMVFASDIDISGNQTVLQEVAALANT
ncbi:MAG TPA: beta-galactosidase [Ktedonobacteraceae bacterium]